MKVPRRGSGPRLRAAEVIAGASALVLLVVMFLPWYDLEYTSSFLDLVVVNAGRNGWQALDLIALFVALAIAAALAVVGLRVLGSPWKPLIAPGAAVAVLGGLATLLVLFRILVPPSLGLEELSFDVTPGLPAFIGLAAAFGVAFGGYRAMGQEGTSFAGVADRLSPRKPKKAAAKKSQSAPPRSRAPRASRKR
jgi:hypothetical protein